MLKPGNFQVESAYNCAFNGEIVHPIKLYLLTEKFIEKNY